MGAEDVSVGKRRREATRADTREREPGRRAAHPRPPPEADRIDARAPEVLKTPQHGDGGHGALTSPVFGVGRQRPPQRMGPGQRKCCRTASQTRGRLRAMSCTRGPQNELPWAPQQKTRIATEAVSALLGL